MWHSVWNHAGTLNRLAAALALLAFGSFALIAIKNIAARPEFRIQHVVITGTLANADRAHITAVVQQELRGTFFTLDLARSRDALQKVKWVRSVAVRRHWPARIEIAVEEQQPLARWNDVQLVNVQGEVFDAEYGEELPEFYAPEGTASEVTSRYREFSTLLARSQLSIDSLSRSARGAWDVKLDDGMVIALGREQVSERWTRWMNVSDRYRNRIAQGKALTAIDMRYANGFAARFAGLPEPASMAKKTPAIKSAAKG